jgi:hypothetical protein
MLRAFATEMRPRSAVALAVLLGVAVAAWFLTRPSALKRTSPVAPRPQASATPQPGSTTPREASRAGNNRQAMPPEIAPASTPPIPPSPSQTGTSPLPAEASVPAAGPLNAASERQLLEVLENVRVMIRDYRTALGENPVGTNAEIMRAINGDNAKQARIGAPPGQGLNNSGELVDPWGTPFFFHQVSRTEMEIRSAGPDRVMWTADDREVK